MARGILEREPALAQLATAAREAADGAGSVVLVFGEAGIGKSSLVRAMPDRLPGQARVLVGQCDDLATRRPPRAVPRPRRQRRRRTRPRRHRGRRPPPRLRGLPGRPAFPRPAHGAAARPARPHLPRRRAEPRTPPAPPPRPGLPRTPRAPPASARLSLDAVRTLSAAGRLDPAQVYEVTSDGRGPGPRPRQLPRHLRPPARIKADRDPENVFRLNQNIRPS
ncbi:AAA family ATPase [Streptomyces sp. NPDC001537]